jgi:putative MATE family efflux protein
MVLQHKRNASYDLTTGGILNKLFVIALPVMGTQLIQMSYNLTDMFWLGRLPNGTVAVAATGTCGLYLWLSMSLLMMGRMGAEIGVSQNLGRGDSAAARGYGENAFTLSAVLGVLFGLALFFLRRPLIGFFAIQEAAVVSSAESYLAIVSIGIPFSFMTAALVGCFNGSGNSRAPFFINAAGLITNMALDPLFIFVFDMGVAGAAIATVIAQGVSLLLIALAMRRSASRPFIHFRFFTRPGARILKQIFRWSAPISAESAFFTFMTMITTSMVSPFGQDALAVGRIGSQIESLTWLIGGGYGSALVAFMGQNCGAGLWSRIHRGFELSLWAMGAWGILVTLLLWFLGGDLFRFFLPDPGIQQLGIVYLRILAFCQIPQCLEAVSGGTFKGIGQTLPPSIVSVATNVLRVLLAWLFVGIWGVQGVWGAISLTALLRGLFSMTWYLLSARRQPRTDG